MSRASGRVSRTGQRRSGYDSRRGHGRRSGCGIRRGHGSRRAAGAVLLLALVLAAVLAPLVLTACGSSADPFPGLYWEPTTGRRVEVRHDAAGYRLYYGRDRRAYAAVREGDELVITDPMGGKTVLQQGEEEGTLELTTGGKTTLLKPLPQHQ